MDYNERARTVMCAAEASVAARVCRVISENKLQSICSDILGNIFIRMTWMQITEMRLQ